MAGSHRPLALRGCPSGLRVCAGLQAALLCLFASTAFAVPADALHHRVKLEGKGSPTVVLESGLGDTLETWSGVQSLIAGGCARTIAYNRAGYLGSDPSNAPRDSATIVAELRAELQRRNLKPPYVLVGHSLGGLYMQYFARNFPREVAGLLLVDSTHWGQSLDMGNQANTPYNSRRAVTLFMPWIMRREITDSVLAGEQVHASPAGRAESPPSSCQAPWDPPASRPRRAALPPACRMRSRRTFPGARHVRVFDSGHYIQRDHPEVIVQAARELAGCK